MSGSNFIMLALLATATLGYVFGRVHQFEDAAIEARSGKICFGKEECYTTERN